MQPASSRSAGGAAIKISQPQALGHGGAGVQHDQSAVPARGHRRMVQDATLQHQWQAISACPVAGVTAARIEILDQAAMCRQLSARSCPGPAPRGPAAGRHSPAPTSGTRRDSPTPGRCRASPGQSPCASRGGRVVQSAAARIGPRPGSSSRRWSARTAPDQPVGPQPRPPGSLPRSFSVMAICAIMSLTGPPGRGRCSQDAPDLSTSSPEHVLQADVLGDIAKSASIAARRGPDARAPRPWSRRTAHVERQNLGQKVPRAAAWMQGMLGLALGHREQAQQADRLGATEAGRALFQRPETRPGSRLAAHPSRCRRTGRPHPSEGPFA